MRTSEITRKTTETTISLRLAVDGSGQSSISSGCGFLDHMLTLWASHGRFDLTLSCTGDTSVDYHHSVEDIGICLGEVLRQALGEKRGVARYGSIILPMDEALILCAVDLSGRGHLEYALDIPTEKVGSFDTELVREFLLAFCRNAQLTLHVRQLSGINSHHIIEGCFKSMAHALRQAVRIDAAAADDIPSTKGVL